MRHSSGTVQHFLRMGTLVLLTICAMTLWTLQYLATQPPRSIEELMHREGIPGAMIAWRDAEGNMTTRQIGESVTQPALPLAPTTRFPIASLSKPITASVIRRLVGQGRLNLDDRVFELLPNMAHAEDVRYRDITVRHLLQHTSGLNQTPDDPMFHGGRPAGCRHALAVTLQRPLDSTPGIRMRYSNAGYCLLGELIAHIGNADYGQVVHDELMLPPESGLTLGPPCKGIPHEGSYLRDEEWEEVGAAGGWFSDVETLISLFAADIPSPDIPAQPVAPHEGWYYGLGWRVWPHGKDYRLTHFGSLPGMFSIALAYPDGRVAVALFNGRPRDSEAFAMQMYRLLDKEFLDHAIGPLFASAD